MNIPYKAIKWITAIVVFLIIASGCWFHLTSLNEWSTPSIIFHALAYGSLLALLSCFMVDLVLARGLLQFKITLIKFILLYLAILIFLNKFLDDRHNHNITIFIVVEFFITLILSISLLLIDVMKKANRDFLICSEVKDIPSKYLTSHPIRTFFETIFRLFPYPEPVGLYKIGYPTKQSQVFVTVNYELTIRRVVQALRGKDCWLLVCDSRGINSWCSSLANHFGTEDIIEAIKLTHLTDYVSHRKLIIPQLCAANISIETIKRETAFNSQFGPLDISNIDVYLKGSDGQDFRSATFGLKSRLEMALGSPIMLLILLIFIYNFIGLSRLLVIIPIIYIWSLIQASIHPYRLIKSIPIWSLCFGCIVFITNYLVASTCLKLDFLGSNMAISLGMVYLINEFTGWSPLTKYSFIHHKTAEIFIDDARCIGCHRCLDVCPKSVFWFENEKSKVSNPEECISCRSCFSQCPAGAIIHSADKRQTAGNRSQVP